MECQRVPDLADRNDFDLQADDIADNSGIAVVDIQPVDEEKGYRMGSPYEWWRWRQENQGGFP